jgi:DNA-binding beta-propeller fold protein YncE
MKLHRRWSLLALAALAIVAANVAVSSAYVLVADRPLDRILKYSDSGSFLGVVVQDVPNMGGSGNTHGPGSFTLSPDGSKLWVASLNNKVIRYDFNGTTASNPLVVTSNGSSTISDPGGIILNPAGTTVFVANRGFGFSDAVARLDANGVSQGADYQGGGFTGRTGLAYGPGGTLLAGTFGSDFMGGGPGGGGVKLDAGTTSIVPIVAHDPTHARHSSLLVRGNQQ